jgi:2-polyprenyl-6-methoxyphenol hydroxylase-like FAD-dependent oxidoreductase
VLKRFIFWDYPRASWQYDVMVGIILIFIMLTPRWWFRDQPRTPLVSTIAVLPEEHGSSVYWVEPELLADLSKEQQAQKLAELLRNVTHRKQVTVTRVEPIADSDGETKGYMVFAKP